jgi:DNA helicase-2/ATP-dependent DNA helicase PcrA
LANSAISENLNQFPKNLRPSRQAEKYPKPALISLKNSNDQAALVAQRIGDLLEEGVELNEIAVLYRAHYHAMELQLELTRRNIPFELLSGLRFFEQAHVKDVAAFMKFALNPQDEVSFLRISKLIPGVGEKTAGRLWPLVKGGANLGKVKPPDKGAKIWAQFAATHEQIRLQKDRPSLQIQTILDALYEDYMKAEFTNYPSRMEDLSQLRAFADTFSTTEEFLVQLALLTSVDGGPRTETKSDHRGPSVRLSTIHQAKGLEWKVVFVIMLCEGLFPHYKAEDVAAIEEERRLFYVAVTRAQDELYLTHPFMRATSDGNSPQEPSRFLTDLPRSLVNIWRIVKDQPNPF